MGKIRDNTVRVPLFKGVYSKQLQDALIDALKMQGDRFSKWNFIIGTFIKLGYTISEMVDYTNQYCHYPEYSMTKTIEFIRMHPHYKSGYPQGASTPNVFNPVRPNPLKSDAKKQYTVFDILTLFHDSFKPQPPLTISSNIVEAAKEYFERGFHIFPVGQDKKPLGQWRNGIVDYTIYALDPSTLRSGMLDHGFAVLGTDRHVFLDVDAKNAAHPGGIDQAGLERIREMFQGWHVEESKNGGLHIWGIGDLKTVDDRAHFTASDAEMTVKGRGSYIVVFPTPGYSQIPLR